MSFWAIFCPFTLSMDPKNQNFEKMKKMPADITILRMCIINDNHMMYGSWDIKYDRHNVLSFWTIFCSFSKFWETGNNMWRYHHFTKVYQKSWSYAMLFMRYGAWQIYLLFFIWGYFLPFYPPNSPKNQNFKKMKQKPGDITILHMCTKNYDQVMYGSWDIARERRTAKQTDRQKKWHIEVAAPPNKTIFVIFCNI